MKKIYKDWFGNLISEMTEVIDIIDKNFISCFKDLGYVVVSSEKEENLVRIKERNNKKLLVLNKSRKFDAEKDDIQLSKVQELLKNNGGGEKLSSFIFRLLNGCDKRKEFWKNVNLSFFKVSAKDDYMPLINEVHKSGKVSKYQVEKTLSFDGPNYSRLFSQESISLVLFLVICKIISNVLSNKETLRKDHFDPVDALKKAENNALVRHEESVKSYLKKLSRLKN